MHLNHPLQSNGLTNHSESSETKNIFDINDMSSNEEQETYNEIFMNSVDKNDNLTNLLNDTTTDGKLAWKGVLCSPFDSHHSPIMMKSHVWPGATAVAYKSYVILIIFLYYFLLVHFKIVIVVKKDKINFLL